MTDTSKRHRLWIDAEREQGSAVREEVCEGQPSDTCVQIEVGGVMDRVPLMHARYLPGDCKKAFFIDPPAMNTPLFLKSYFYVPPEYRGIREEVNTEPQFLVHERILEQLSALDEQFEAIVAAHAKEIRCIGRRRWRSWLDTVKNRILSRHVESLVTSSQSGALADACFFRIIPHLYTRCQHQDHPNPLTGCPQAVSRLIVTCLRYGSVGTASCDVLERFVREVKWTVPNLIDELRIHHELISYEASRATGTSLHSSR